MLSPPVRAQRNKKSSLDFISIFGSGGAKGADVAGGALTIHWVEIGFAQHHRDLF
jgi:hypothetical protein